jgi:hypothetical protein
MSGLTFLDVALTILFLLIILLLYIVTPLVLAIFLLKKRWMNNRLKTFFGIILIINIIGYIVLILIKG